MVIKKIILWRFRYHLRIHGMGSLIRFTTQMMIISHVYSFHMNIHGMFYICKAEHNLVNQFIIDITKKRLINKKCYWFVILFTFYFNFYRSIIQV